MSTWQAGRAAPAGSHLGLDGSHVGGGSLRDARSSASELGLGLALTLALGPEVAAHASEARAACGELQLGIWLAVVSPPRTHPVVISSL